MLQKLALLPTQFSILCLLTDSTTPFTTPLLIWASCPQPPVFLFLRSLGIEPLLIKLSFCLCLYLYFYFWKDSCMHCFALGLTDYYYLFHIDSLYLQGGLEIIVVSSSSSSPSSASSTVSVVSSWPHFYMRLQAWVFDLHLHLSVSLSPPKTRFRVVSATVGFYPTPARIVVPGKFRFFARTILWMMMLLFKVDF